MIIIDQTINIKVANYNKWIKVINYAIFKTVNYAIFKSVNYAIFKTVNYIKGIIGEEVI